MVSAEDFAKWKAAFEAAWLQLADDLYPSGETLHRACRYAMQSQGKRIRPLLAFAAAEACGGDWASAMPAALALECVHGYSLVHDDLPCMDNDDLRRGRPTTHKAFDEATALLVGDALLTDAFGLLAVADVTDKQRLAMIKTLGRAAGGQGMVQGQALDMHWTGRQGYQKAELDAIHRGKTAALIAASAVMGGQAAGASATQEMDLQAFGEALGLAFQIIDDLLDEQPGTGKSQGKDASAGKLSYLAVMSRAAAEQEAQEKTRAAITMADRFGKKGQQLKALADELLTRKS